MTSKSLSAMSAKVQLFSLLPKGRDLAYQFTVKKVMSSVTKVTSIDSYSSYAFFNHVNQIFVLHVEVMRSPFRSDRLTIKLQLNPYLMFFRIAVDQT